MWLPLMCPAPGTWPTTQACALTGNQTSNLWIRRPVLNPLSHTSQAFKNIFIQNVLLSKSSSYSRDKSFLSKPIFSKKKIFSIHKLRPLWIDPFLKLIPVVFFIKKFFFATGVAKVRS